MDQRTYRPRDPVTIEGLVGEIAAERGVDPLDLPPLFDSIDPDGLERMLESPTVDRIEFDYNGWTIVIDSSTGVEVTPALG